MNELKNAALGMKGSLVQNGRCPKCTLKPPCKHFESPEDIPKDPPPPSLVPGLGVRNESEASKFTTSSSIAPPLTTLQSSGAQVL
jgi:hypothetical protein